MQHLEFLLTKLKPQHDDTLVDRINYIYTPMMLFGFAMTIGAKQYVGQPLQCWPPAEFNSAWEKYAEGLCFMENTYFVSMEERFPKNPADRASRELHYYQWVSFFLLAQMLLFMLPKALWNTASFKCGYSIGSLVNKSMELKKVKDKKDKELKSVDEAKRDCELVASRIGFQLKSSAKVEQRKCKKDVDCKKETDVSEYIDYRKINPQHNWLTFLYFAFKALNLLNSIIQFYLLNKFIGSEYSFWGFGVITDLFHGRQWKESGFFPRVTFCDATVRQPGNLGPLNFTMQCVLMVNMFNEKIYIFIWFWLVAISVINTLDLLDCFFTFTFWGRSVAFIKSRMSRDQFKIYFNGASDANEEEGEQRMEDDLKLFVQKCLCRDGCTTIRLIDINCGPFVSAAIIRHLWKSFQKDIELARSNDAPVQQNPMVSCNNNRSSESTENPINLETSMNSSIYV